LNELLCPTKVGTDVAAAAVGGVVDLKGALGLLKVILKFQLGNLKKYNCYFSNCKTYLTTLMLSEYLGLSHK